MSVLSSFAWPATLAIIAIFFMVKFHRSIDLFLQRTTKIGIGSSAVEATVPRQEPSPELKPSSTADDLLKLFDNALLVKREEEIRSELERRSIPSADRERVLIRFWAAVGLTAQFDRTYSLIWGSQLVALQLLNPLGDTGIEADFLRLTYEHAATQNPKIYETHNFDHWLGFMVLSELVRLEGKKVFIRVEGREFLRYIVERGYPIYKQF
jgi:hypothetical protein